MEYKQMMPLSDSQIGIYLECANDETSLMYNITFEYVFDKTIDGEKLREACNKVFSHYAAFRTVVDIVKGMPMLVLSDSVPSCGYIKTSESEYKNILSNYAKNFKLDKDILCYADVIETEENIYLLFEIHHIIYDGLSSNVFEKALELAYKGEELPAEDVNVFAAGEMEREYNASGKSAASFDYFEKLLKDKNTTKFPVDVKDGNPGKCVKYVYELPISVSKFAKENGVSENVVMLSAFSMALSKYVNKKDVLFTSIESGRFGKPLENTVGFFVRTFPLAFEIDEGKSGGDFAKYVKANYKEAMSHDDASFSELASRFKLDSKIKYVYQGNVIGDFAFCGTKVRKSLCESDDALSDIDFVVFKVDDGFRIQIDYCGLYSKENIEKFAHTFNDTVKALVGENKPEAGMKDRLIKIVSEVIGESIGENTNFFDAGLSSIGVIRICATIGEEFGVSLNLKNIRENDTVEKLEKYISSLGGKATTDDVKDYPLTKTQEGIYIECISKPGALNYNIPSLLKIDESIDEDKLKRAIVAAVDAHSYIDLRLFTNKDGKIRQKMGNDTFTVSDIKVTYADNIDKIKDNLMRPFELIGGRLFRFEIIHADGLYLYSDMHHIISDGTSVNIFVADIMRAYEGEALTPETYTGFDVAKTETRNRTAEELRAAKAHFDKYFGDADADFLPRSDKHPNWEPASGVLELVSKDGQFAKAKKFCEENKLSMNGLLLSVFGFVLAKYNAEDYSVFTTVYNGRNDSNVAKTVSMLTKTLPVYVSAEDAAPVSLAKDTADQLLDSMVNDVYSFAEISREYGIHSDIMFIYQGAGFTLDTFCGKPATDIPIVMNDKKSPISVQAFNDDKNFIYKVDFDNNKYTEKLIECFVRAFDFAIGSFVDSESTKDVTLVDPEMIAELDAFNETEVPFDETQTMVSWFEKTAQTYKDNIAVYSDGRRYTYAELLDLTARVAKYINDKGIGKDDFVPILVNRNEYMVIGTYGILRAGAAYEPIDPDYPEERIHFMIEDTGAKFAIADRDLAGAFESAGIEVLCTDEIPNLPEAPDFKSNVSPDDRFIIIYTSGTTGTPKGNVLAHRQPVALFNYHIKKCGMLTPESRTAYFTGFGFDAGMLDLHGPLLSGGRFYVVPEDMRLDLFKMDEFFCDHEITNSGMTTQMGSIFIKMTKCKTLKVFVVGGEKLVPFTPPEGLRFMNQYGPSECTVYATEHLVTDDTAYQPIGKPIDNTKCYIVDKECHRLPFGAAGELLIASKQVGLGYLGRPEKTAEVFVENPFCATEGYRRLYHTGDIVRELTDGEYDFVGRKDGQVKIRGFRVELSEIEKIVREYPDVINATVQAFDDSNGGKYVAAFVTSDTEVDFEKLADFIGQSKPAYMIPAAFSQLDKIPLTANGKVDKRALKKPEITSTKKAGREPADEVEEKFCDIFKEVLGIDKVYANDDFFSIGGSSISAAQAVVKCDAAGFNIVFNDFFENPSPQKLAHFVGTAVVNDILAPTGAEREKYDYSCLAYNVQENLPNIRWSPLGDILLTGATGYLGSHLFKAIMDKTDSNVICLVRGKGELSAEERFKLTMIYYFEDWYTEKIANRTLIIDGTLDDADIDEKLDGFDFDMIINNAANVKHFDHGDNLINDNFRGVENLISLAEKRGAKLIQASSLSVCGESVNGSIGTDFKFKEFNLNIGQSLKNQYVYTKYLAEQAIIDAISRGRIKGKIIRLGNLAARIEDGQFQINASNSGLMKILQGYVNLGCYPVEMLDAPIEFSPIDKVAEAMILLAGTPDEFTVFHAKNCNEIHYSYIINALRERGYKIDIVPNDEFEARFKHVLDTEKDVSGYTGFIAYLARTDSKVTDAMVYNGDDSNSKEAAEGKDYEVRIRISSDTSYTTKALYRLGFSWPLIGNEYFKDMIDMLSERDFF